ncbi:MAG: PLP-dependent transferase [Bacteroidia bacterium]|nr:PLP-dependent transferase [Bacteroidia bacterium]
MKFDTKAVQSTIQFDPTTGSVVAPIYQTSTYAQSAPGVHKGYEYARTHNPTRELLESSLATIENAKHGIAFGSGLAAIDAIMKLFKSGDEVISTSDLYGGTYRIYTKIFEKYGMKFKFIGMENAEDIEAHINENTKMIWVETPTNPMMNVIDIKKSSEIAKKYDLLLAVDNTFASPYLQNPIDLGADIVMHSATKYLAGHSDVILGILACNSDELAEELRFIQNSSGAVPGPMDCFLTLRGIKTLHLRMERHASNGKRVAEYLFKHPKVDKVYWPGFESHPNHEIAKAQMKDFGGMISFTLVSDNIEDTVKVISNMKLFTLAESLGGIESLVGHPAVMTHASIPKEEREKVGLKDSLIRLSVGIEDPDDLCEDLEIAIAKIGELVS